MTIKVPMRFESEPLLWTVYNVYSQQECNNFIDLIETSNPQLATNNPLYRNQDRLILDNSQISENLFQRLYPHLQKKWENLY